MPTYKDLFKQNHKYYYIYEDLCAVTGVMQGANVSTKSAESIGSVSDKRKKLDLSARKNKSDNLFGTYNTISSAQSKMTNEDSNVSSNSATGSCSESECSTSSEHSRMSEELYKKTPLKKRPLKQCALLQDLNPIVESTEYETSQQCFKARISSEKKSEGILNTERSFLAGNDVKTSAGNVTLPSSILIAPNGIITTGMKSSKYSASKQSPKASTPKSPKNSSRRSGRKAPKRSGRKAPKRSGRKAPKRSGRKASKKPPKKVTAKPKRISRQVRDDFIMAKHMQAREFNLRERVVQLPKGVEVEESNSEPGTSGIGIFGGGVLSSLAKA